LNRLRLFFSAYPVVFAMAAKLSVLSLFLPGFIEGMAVARGHGMQIGASGFADALVSLAFRLCCFAAAAVLASTVLFGRGGALWIRHPLASGVSFYLMLIVLDHLSVWMYLQMGPPDAHSLVWVVAASLLHTLLLTAVALLPALLLQRGRAIQGPHTGVVSASQVGAGMLLLGGACLPAILVQLRLMALESGSPTVGDGLWLELQIVLLLTLVLAALASTAGVVTGITPSAAPAMGRVLATAALLTGTASLIVILVSGVLLMIAQVPGPFGLLLLALAMLAASAAQYRLARTLASRRLATPAH